MPHSDRRGRGGRRAAEGGKATAHRELCAEKEGAGESGGKSGVGKGGWRDERRVQVKELYVWGVVVEGVCLGPGINIFIHAGPATVPTDGHVQGSIEERRRKTSKFRCRFAGPERRSGGNLACEGDLH